jgi:hypothetical protein
MADPDFLYEQIARRAAGNAAFPSLLDAARRRELLHALAERREEPEHSQTALAGAMATSHSAVARLETTATEAKISTIQRYAESRGYVVQYRLMPAADAADTPPVVVR